MGTHEIEAIVLTPDRYLAISSSGEGLGLHELTVLAATLEHLIHDEADTGRFYLSVVDGEGWRGWCLDLQASIWPLEAGKVLRFGSCGFASMVL